MENFMRTNIDIDDALMASAMKALKTNTKKETVEKALKQSLEQSKSLDIRELRGKVKFFDGYDYKALRTPRFPST
jgi:Arc/MetJ family transcription regulator